MEEIIRNSSVIACILWGLGLTFWVVRMKKRGEYYKKDTV